MNNGRDRTAGIIRGREKDTDGLPSTSDSRGGNRPRGDEFPLYHAKARLHSFTFSSILKKNARYGNATPSSIEPMIFLFRNQENVLVFNGVIHDVAEHRLTDNHYDKL